MTELLTTGALGGIIIGTLLYLKSAVAQRPTFKEADEKYKSQVACDEIVKRLEENVKPIPEIRDSLIEVKTKLDILISNGKRKEK